MNARWKIFLFPIFLILLGACSRTRPVFTVAVQVQHDASDGAWTVTYKLSEPVQGLEFRRQRNAFRANTWQPSDPSMQVQSAGNTEIVTSSRGSFDVFQARFRPYYMETPKDYEFFVLYSDGSVALYSGHFDVIPLACRSGGSCAPGDLVERTGDEIKTMYNFVPAPNENVSVDGTTSSGPVPWQAVGDGTYVYFGPEEVQDYGLYRGILDPQLPSWIKVEVHKLVPAVLNLYAEKTGYDLTVKPLVYFARTGAETGYSAKGGVLHHQVRMSLAGLTWATETKENLETLRLLIAHEAAHFWNADLFLPDAGNGDSWMHEGGADAFAYRALYLLNDVDKDRYMALLSQALNRCSLDLGETSLHDAERDGRFLDAYNCGSTIGLMTEAAVKPADSDLFVFWRNLFHQASRNNNVYTPDMYLQTVRQDSGDDARANLVASVVTRPLGDAGGYFAKALKELGVETARADENAPSWFRSEMGLKALRNLSSTDCGPAARLDAFSSYVEVRGGSDCRTLKNNYNIDRAGPYSVLYEGERAYDYISDQCKSHGSVDLHLYGGNSSLSASCANLAPRPHFLLIKKF